MKEKKILIFILFIITAISCCKDDDGQEQINIDVPLGTIITEIDGIERTFNIDAKAVFDTILWTFQRTAVKLSISGKSTDEIDAENILIWFFVTPVREIDAGTYPDLNKQIYHYIEFNREFNGELYNWGSNRTVEGYDSTSTIIRNDSLIQGVFNGVVAIGAGPNINEPQPPLTYKMEKGIFNVRLTE